MMMRRLTASVAVLAFAAVSACDRTEPQPPAPVEAPVAQSPTSNVAAVTYACESGASVEARYPDTETAQLTYRGQTYALRTAPAASGARYVGSGVEWWTATRDGQEGATLSRLGSNEDVGVAVLERCSRPGVGTVTPGRGQTPVPAPGGVLPVAAPCKGPQLKLSNEGGDAGAGNRVNLIGVQNVGARACSVTGYPTVTVQDARGRTLTGVRAEQATGSYFRAGEAPKPVELAARQKGFFEIAWNIMPHEGQGETVCPTAARIRVTAPGDTAPVDLDQTFTPCGGRINVSPFIAKAGANYEGG